jgi:hypothetical protein
MSFLSGKKQFWTLRGENILGAQKRAAALAAALGFVELALGANR